MISSVKRPGRRRELSATFFSASASLGVGSIPPRLLAACSLIRGMVHRDERMEWEIDERKHGTNGKGEALETSPSSSPSRQRGALHVKEEYSQTGREVQDCEGDSC